MSKNKLQDVWGYTVMFAPLLLFFFIKWYWVILIYNILLTALSIIVWKHNTNENKQLRKKFGITKVILLPLFFNVFGLLYLILKMGDAGILNDKPLSDVSSPNDDVINSGSTLNEEDEPKIIQEKKSKYNYDNLKELIEQLKEHKPKIKVSSSERISGFWQLKDGEDIPAEASEISLDRYKEESQNELGFAAPEDGVFDKSKKIYDNTYYSDIKAWYDINALIKNIEDYLVHSEFEKNTWDGFYEWAMDNGNLHLYNPWGINSDENCKIISYNKGYPEGKNNISWDEIYELKYNEYDLKIMEDNKVVKGIKYVGTTFYRIEYTSGGESCFIEREEPFYTSRYELLELESDDYGFGDVGGNILDCLDEFYIDEDDKLVDIAALEKVHGEYEYDIGSGTHDEGEYDDKEKAIEAFNRLKEKFKK